MGEHDIEAYLADNEECRRQWGGKLKDEGLSQNSHTFVATDRRLAILKDDGSFSDIDYNHITSIQTDSNRAHPKWPVWALLFSGLFILGGLANFFNGNVGDGFAALAVGGFIYGTVYFFAPDEHATETKHEITIVTSDERANEITFTTDENVGATLSKVIRDD